MRKKLFVLVALLLCLMTSCGDPLGEAEGVFPDGVSVLEEICSHSLRYDYPSNHDMDRKYANVKYHYVWCEMSEFNPHCSLTGEYERHTAVFSDYSGMKVMYNGRYYHTANQSCLVCGKSAEPIYVLCSRNDGTCKGDCANALKYREESLNEGDT